MAEIHLGASNYLQGTDGKAYVSNYVWDVNALSWVKFTGSEGVAGGSATSANQTTEITRLTSIRDRLDASVAVTGTFYQATQPVVDTENTNIAKIKRANDRTLVYTWLDRGTANARISVIVIASVVLGKTATGTYTYVLDNGTYYATNFNWVVT